MQALDITVPSKFMQKKHYIAKYSVCTAHRFVSRHLGFYGNKQ